MTTFHFRRVCASALFLLPALAQAAGTSPTPPQPPKSVLALRSAAAEAQTVLDATPHLGRALERLGAFQHTPDTAQALRDAFGNERPWSVERLGAKGSGTHYRVSILPVRHTGEDGATISWREFPIEVEVDKSGRQLGYGGLWPELRVEDRDIAFSLRDLDLRGKQRRDASGIWFGDVALRGAAMAMEVRDKAGKQTTVEMREFDFASKVSERGTLVDIQQRMRLGVIGVEGVLVEDVAMAWRLVNLERKSLAALAAAEKKRMASGRVEPDAADLKSMLRLLATAATGRGARLHIDRISASYGGHTALIKGSLGIRKGASGSLDSPATFLRRVDGRFELAVPVALIKAVTLELAQRQAAAQAAAAGNPAPAADLTATAQTMTDLVVGKAVGGGFARLDGEVLRATVEIKQGVIYINGKKITLPKPNQAPQGAPAVSMQARKVDGSCSLPEYPQEVIERDVPLSLTVVAMVSEEGVPREIRVLAPSAWPDYDRQALEAMTQCRYVPALQGDKPVAQPVALSIRREPGTRRP